MNKTLCIGCIVHALWKAAHFPTCPSFINNCAPGCIKRLAWKYFTFRPSYNMVLATLLYKAVWTAAGAFVYLSICSIQQEEETKRRHWIIWVLKMQKTEGRHLTEEQRMGCARLSNAEYGLSKIKHFHVVFSDEKDATICMYLVFHMPRHYKTDEICSSRLFLVQKHSRN